MDKRKMEIAAEATYERNTTAVKSALLALKRAEPEAVVIVGAYKPVAEFIKLSKKISFNPVFVNISFVGANALAAELGPDGKGVIVSPGGAVPGRHLAAGRRGLSQGAEGVGPEGRAGVRLARRLSGRPPRDRGAGASRQGRDPRGSMLKVMKDGKFDIGGLPMTFTAEKNEGLDKVWMTIIEADGKFKPIEKMIRISAN